MSTTPKSNRTTHTPGPFYVTHGMIFTVGDPYGHGQMRIADIRGWGHLTGGGACNFNEDKAAAIQDATAEFIVRACNAHDDLVAALDALREDYERLCGDGLTDSNLPDVLRQALKALAKAEGRS